MNAPNEFEWNDSKASSNEEKHGIPFEAAIGVFSDGNRLDEIDDRKNYGEERRNVIGVVDGYCLTVTYTMRGDICRIISARPASRSERMSYGYSS